MKMGKTFCMGYWVVPGNKKRILDHYLTHLPETIKLLSYQKLVFWYNEEKIKKTVMPLVLDYKVEVLFRKICIEQLPAYPYAMNFLKMTEDFGRDAVLLNEYNVKKEKAREHYFSDYLRGGPDAYLKMLAIWLSKVPIVAEVARENPFDTDTFAWVDASISRFNRKRDFYDIGKLRDWSCEIMYYKGKRAKRRKRLAINASYISGDSCAWRELQDIYSRQMLKLSNELYPNDEETVLDACISANSEIFRLINPSRNHMLVRLLENLRLGSYAPIWSR